MFNKERENIARMSYLKLGITTWRNIEKMWQWFTFENFIQKLIFSTNILILRTLRQGLHKLPQ